MEDLGGEVQGSSVPLVVCDIAGQGREAKADECIEWRSELYVWMSRADDVDADGKVLGYSLCLRLAELFHSFGK